MSIANCRGDELKAQIVAKYTFILSLLLLAVPTLLEVLF